MHLQAEYCTDMERILPHLWTAPVHALKSWTDPELHYSIFVQNLQKCIQFALKLSRISSSILQDCPELCHNRKLHVKNRASSKGYRQYGQNCSKSVHNLPETLRFCPLPRKDMDNFGAKIRLPGSVWRKTPKSAISFSYPARECYRSVQYSV